MTATTRTSTKPKPVLLGNTAARVFTPPLRKLTPKTSLGYQAIDFATHVMGITLTPWQKWFLVHALELVDVDSPFIMTELRFSTILLLIARQNGKTTIAQVVIAWRMFLSDNPGTIIGAAQKLPTAEKTWLETLRLVKKIPELATEIPKGGISMRNGARGFELKNGAEYLVQAANEDGGRGMSAVMAFLDEVRQYKDFSGWDAIASTTVAQTDSLVFAASNAGDMTSRVLNQLRKSAHGHPDIGDPDKLYKEGEELPERDDSLGIFEWSAAPWRSISDRQGWAEANPSCGYTGLTEKAILSSMMTKTATGFRTEHLCQTVESMIIPPFKEGVWERGIDPASEIPLGGRYVLAVEVSFDRTRAYISTAGFRADGNIHVEVVNQGEGVSWVRPWLKKRQDDPLLIGVVIQMRGSGASSLTVELFRGLKVDVLEWGGSDLTKGTGAFFDLVAATADTKAQLLINPDQKFIFHREQPVLDLPATSARKKQLGGAFVWDLNSPEVDAAPLVAVTGAVWALLSAPPPYVSPYDAFDDPGADDDDDDDDYY